MLSPRPSERYQSARQVLQALTDNLAAPASAPTQPDWARTQATKAYAGREEGATPHQVAAPSSTPSPSQPSNWSFTPGKILLVLLLFASAVGVGWLGGNLWLQFQSTLPPQDEITPEPTESPSSIPTVDPELRPSPQFSAQEQNRKEQLGDRRQQLGIDYRFYVDLLTYSRR